MDVFVHTVEVALCHEGHLFVITRPEGKHAGGMLAFPGGKVDYPDAGHAGDILEVAARRELFEELSYQLCAPLHYVTSQGFTGSNGKRLINTVFWVNLDHKPSFIIPPKEASAAAWMLPEEILASGNCPKWMKSYTARIFEKYMS